MGKVYSISDFKEGLDVRKTALTAPAGSLRILDNAWLTPGGEIEKRPAFVKTTTLPPQTAYLFGQAGQLHIFGIGLAAIVPGTTPHAIIPHELAVPPGGVPVTVIDVEAYNGDFYVLGRAANGAPVVWFKGIILKDADGVTLSQGTYARTYKTKMYRTAGRYLYFSGVGDPGINDTTDASAPGAGFINISINDPDGDVTTSMEIFYDKMAVFARLVTQLWHLDPDPTLDALQQVLRIGTVAPHSVLQFGTGDILFLSDSGVRSLKAQTVTITAAVADVGSPIDPLMTAAIRSQFNAVLGAQAIVQPIAGRYWLSIADTVYVLSFFPAGNITAWSTFSAGFTINEFAVVANRVYCRAPDQSLYLFGGVDNTVYDSCPVTVRTPHHDLESPTTRKQIQSVDLMCQGQWTLSMGMLPNNLEAFEPVATVQDNTFGLQSIPFAGYGTHVGLHLTHEAPGPAVLAAIHLNTRELSTK